MAKTAQPLRLLYLKGVLMIKETTTWYCDRCGVDCTADYICGKEFLLRNYDGEIDDAHLIFCKECTKSFGIWLNSSKGETV